MCPKPWWFISWWRERHFFPPISADSIKVFCFSFNYSLLSRSHSPPPSSSASYLCATRYFIPKLTSHRWTWFLPVFQSPHHSFSSFGKASGSQQLDVLVLGLSSEAWLLALGVGVMRAGTLGLGVLASRSCSKRMSAVCCAFSVAERWAGRALKPAVSCSTRCSKLNIWRSRSSLRSFSSDMSSYITLCIYSSPRERQIERRWQMEREMMGGGTGKERESGTEVDMEKMIEIGNDRERQTEE